MNGHTVIAILRGSKSDELPLVVQTLADAGITAIEFTMTTPGALSSLGAIRTQVPAVTFGVGTVLDGATATLAIEAGAAFLVTPAVAEDVIDVAVDAGVPVIVGAMTPTEIVSAARLGATAVKVFPVSNLGGVDYIRALRGPFPDIPLVPTGGVELDDIGRYLEAGCIAVGLGSPLVGDALSGGSLEALAERARRAVEAAAPR